eukprot:3400522-Pyramimonas_sp.AAC.1
MVSLGLYYPAHIRRMATTRASTTYSSHHAESPVRTRYMHVIGYMPEESGAVAGGAGKLGGSSEATGPYDGCASSDIPPSTGKPLVGAGTSRGDAAGASGAALAEHLPLGGTEADAFGAAGAASGAWIGTDTSTFAGSG